MAEPPSSDQAPDQGLDLPTVHSFENVTEDGGVCKRILTEGTGSPPALHSKCLGEDSGCLTSCLEDMQ